MDTNTAARRLGSPRFSIGARWIALLVVMTSSCVSYAPGIPLPDILDEVNSTLQPKVIILQAGDAIAISSASNPKVNHTAKIRPDGKATFKVVGELQVEGLAVEELRESLTLLYGEQITAPDIEVRSGGIGGRNVFFIGSINQGTLPVSPGMNLDLIEAMARLGIPRDTFTTVEHTVLIRWMPDEGRRRSWVIDASSEYWTNPEKMLLQAGDIVYIPRHPIRGAAEWMREVARLFPIPSFVRFID